MSLEETITMLDKKIADLYSDKDIGTYSGEDKLIEHNKEVSIDDKLKTLLENYQTTKDITLLEDYLDLLSNMSLPDFKHYLLIQLDNGRNVLEEISNNKIDISYSSNVQMLNDPDLTRILIQTKNKEGFTFAREKDFLMEIDGKTVLEHLLESNMFERFWISSITSTPLLFELLVKYNKQECIGNISEEQLFHPYEDGIVLDYLFKNNMIDFTTIGRISSHPEIFNYIIKYNRNSLLEEISEALLSEKLDGKYILDLILEKNLKPSIYNLRNPKLLELIIERDRLDLLSNVSQSSLFMDVPGKEMKLVEYLINHEIIPKECIDAVSRDIDNDNKFYNLLESLDKLNLITKASEAALLKKHGDKTLFEILVDKNVTFEIPAITKSTMIEMIYNSGKIELLQSCRDVMLLTTLPNGKTVIEELVDRNLLEIKNLIKSEELIKYICDNKIYQLYSLLTTTALLKYKDLNTTYLDQILEEAQTNKDINITNLVDDAIWNPIEHAKVRIIYAKHNMHMYLSLLTKEDLLKVRNGIRLIDALLQENPFHNVDKLIPASVRQDVEIAMILKLKGIRQDHIRFESVTAAIEDEYLTTRREEYEILPLTREQEQLLEGLKQIMSDGLGDPKLISTLIANYRYLLSTGSIYSNEIYHLISIKQNNPEFTYQSIQDGAYFSPNKKKVCMDNTNIDTLNHETGHALFTYLANREMPQGFEELIARLSADPKLLEEVSEYSKKFHKLKDRIEQEVEITFMKSYDESITDEKLKEIEEFLNNLNQKEKDKYRKLGYSEDVLDIILGEMYTVEEYLVQDRRIKKHNMVDLILRTQYGPFIAIGDFYDGIYKGQYKGGVLKDSNGHKISPTFGHGIEYYSRGTEWAFNEMIANYSAIVKSNNSEIGIQQLREHIGEELFILLQDYYQKQILQSTRYLQTQQVTL